MSAYCPNQSADLTSSSRVLRMQSKTCDRITSRSMTIHLYYFPPVYISSVLHLARMTSLVLHLTRSTFYPFYVFTHTTSRPYYIVRIVSHLFCNAPEYVTRITSHPYYISPVLLLNLALCTHCGIQQGPAFPCTWPVILQGHRASVSCCTYTRDFLSCIPSRHCCRKNPSIQRLHPWHFEAREYLTRIAFNPQEHGMLSYDEFVSRMIKLGFGHKVCIRFQAFFPRDMNLYPGAQLE